MVGDYRGDDDESDLERQLRDARSQGALHAARSEVQDLHGLTARQELQLEELRRALKLAQGSERALKRELRRSRKESAEQGALLAMQAQSQEPWHGQMQLLCRSTSQTSHQRQVEALERAHHVRMQADAAHLAHRERVEIARVLTKVKAASDEQAALATAKRENWEKAARAKSQRVEGQLAQARKKKEQAAREARLEAEHQARLLEREQQRRKPRRQPRPVIPG